MKLLVERIKESPSVHHFRSDEEWAAAAREIIPELAGELAEPLELDLRTYRTGADLILEGTLVGELGLACGRCLARYRHPLREAFRLVLEPAGTRVPAEPEAARALVRTGMCLGDELEMGWYQGPEIDLGAFLLELVALAVPVQPLCREDCRGLCPRCGADLNSERCTCEAERSASPFAVLRTLRRSAAEGDS
jgi:DUF177 domain-containing protein